MIDVLDSLVGVVIFVVGALYGNRRGRKHAERRIPAVPEAICGCGHHYAMHNEDGTCGFKKSKRELTERGAPIVVNTGYEGRSRKTVYQHEKFEVVNYGCTCKRYTGPEPLPTYIP